jgi:type I restriction enzyme S subunit
MNPEHLLQNFDRLSEAPDAIARLRRFILDLAVRGKLVEQNSNDEPAAELLKRIQAEKESLGLTPRRQGAKKSEKAEQETLGDLAAWREMPFAVPKSWCWVQFSDVFSLEYGDSLPADKRSNTGEYPVYGSNGVVGSHFKYSVNSPCIVVGRKGSAGALNLSRSSCCYVTDVAYFCIPPIELDMAFSFKLFHTLGLDSLGKGVKPGLSRNEAYALPIAIPPLAEQHRIVAKVEELMTLCDQLQAAQTEREQSRDRLVTASLHQLQNSNGFTPRHQDAKRDEKAEQENLGTFAPWRESMFLQNLQHLTTRPAHIKQLRQTILNLAVRGKLVPQDPDDQPAAELLKRIAICKVNKKLETGDMRIKFEPDPDLDQLPLALPSRWSIQSFENLFLFIDYRGNTPHKTDSGIPLITAKNIRMGYLNREPREYISQDTFNIWMTRGYPKIGDLFFTTEAPLANVCLNDISEPFALAQRAICLQPYAKIDTKYLMFALMSELMQTIIDANATGMTASRPELVRQHILTAFQAFFSNGEPRRSRAFR